MQALAPTNTGAPAVSGTAQAGQILTADHGRWSGTTPLSYAYQWRRCDSSGSGCQDISGATSVSYQLTATDIGSTIKVIVTASNSGGTASATSNATAAVTSAPPSDVTAPSISGTVQDGAQLAASSGDWSGTGTISYAYQWQRCNSSGASCSDIAGATGPAYQLSPADVASTITVLVTATNATGTATAASAPTAVVAAAPPPTITSVTHSDQPSGSVSSGTDSVTVFASSTGPGVDQLQITDQQGQVIASYNPGCAGTASNPCPSTSTQTLSVPVSALPLGADTLTLVALDAAGTASTPVSWSFTVIAPPACSDNWVGTSTGSWTTAANWSEGTVPTDHDHACIPAGDTVQITAGTNAVGRLDASGSIAITGGTLSVDDTSAVSTVDNLSMGPSPQTMATLAGAAELDVSGSLTWSIPSGSYGAGMTGSGSTVILPGATAVLNFPGGWGSLQNGRALRNDGSLTLSAGVLSAGGTGETIENAAGATMVLNGDGQLPTGWPELPGGGLWLPPGGGTGTLINKGSIIKASGTAATTIGLPIDNEGSITAQTGSFAFTAGTAPGSPGSPTGTWTASNSASWQFLSGTFQLGAASLTGSVSVAGAQVTASDIQAPAGTLAISGGTLTLTDASVASTVANLDVTETGALAGADEVDVSDALTWSSDVRAQQTAMSGPGTTVVLPGAVANLAFTNDSFGALTGGRTLRNEGTLTLASGLLTTYTAADTIDNAAGATMNLNAEGTADNTPDGLAGPGTFTNEGTVAKAAGTGTTTIGALIANAGTLTADSGTVSFSGGSPAGSAASGTWTAQSSAQLQFVGGTYTMGSTNMTGNVTVASSASVTAADIQAPDASITVGSSQMTYPSGTLTTTSTAPASHIATLTLLNGGRLSGTGEVDVTDTLDWTSTVESGDPTMSGSGSTVIEPGATAALSFTSGAWFSYGQLTNGRSFVNEGTTTLTDGVLFAYGAGESIDNRAGATLNLNADGTTPALPYGVKVSDGIELGSCYTTCTESASLSNEGTITKGPGTGITDLGFTTDNGGTITADSGTLALAGGTTPGRVETGSWSAGTSGLIDFTGGNYALGDAQMTGTIDIDSLANVTARDIQDPSGTITVGQGSLTTTSGSTASHIANLSLNSTYSQLAGAGEVDVSGSLNWSGGTMAGSGSTVLQASATGVIGGSNSTMMLDQRLFKNLGTVSFPAGVIQGEWGAAIANAGTFTANSEDIDQCYGCATKLTMSVPPASYPYTTGPQPQFLNLPGGVLQKTSGTGQLQMTWAFDNEGTVDVQTGELNFEGGGVPAYADLAQLPTIDSTQLDDSQQCPTAPVAQSGSWQTEGSGTVALGGFCYTLGAGTTINGSLQVNTTVQLGAINDSGATITDNGLIDVQTQPLQTQPAMIGNLNLTGTISGPGELDVCGNLNWQSGSINGPGATVLCSGATGTIAPNNSNTTVSLAGGALVNRGTLTWASGSIQPTSPAVIANQGTLDANSETGAMQSGGILYNTGTITKTAGTGQTTI